MAKSARSGEMRTKITIQALTDGINENGFQTKEWANIFGDKKAWCLWVNAHGTEVYDTMRLNLKEPATITMRYTPKVNVRCRIFREDEPQDDAHAYEIISIDNVQDGRSRMEIKVQRMVKA